MLTITVCVSGNFVLMQKWIAYTCGWLVLKSECVLLLRLERISRWFEFTNSQVGFVKAVIDPHLGNSLFCVQRPSCNIF